MVLIFDLFLEWSIYFFDQLHIYIYIYNLPWSFIYIYICFYWSFSLVITHAPYVPRTIDVYGWPFWLKLDWSPGCSFLVFVPPGRSLVEIAGRVGIPTVLLFRLCLFCCCFSFKADERWGHLFLCFSSEGLAWATVIWTCTDLLCLSLFRLSLHLLRSHWDVRFWPFRVCCSTPRQEQSKSASACSTALTCVNSIWDHILISEWTMKDFFFWDGKIRRGEKESIGSYPNTWRVYTLYITYYIWYIIYFIWYDIYIYITDYILYFSYHISYMIYYKLNIYILVYRYYIIYILLHILFSF